MPTLLEIAWLAGLLEGEGSFLINRGVIALQSTDKDIVWKMADILGVPRSRRFWQPGRKASYKKVYYCRVAGYRGMGWMMTLYPFMGERRQATIRKCLERWKASNRPPRGNWGERLPAICHPDKYRHAHMLCRQCWQRDYMRKWRAARRAAA